jgi:holliday junction DNA helicase RuvA
MIIRLTGLLFYKQAPALGLEVNGVGYGVQSSLTTFAYLPNVGQSITLHTHLVIREDAHQLYGFMESHERDMFLMLLKINGVGPRLALAILSTYDVSELIQLIERDDLMGLTRISGIGKKTAERLLIEMRDKVTQWHTLTMDTNPSPSGMLINTDLGIQQEAIAALQSLGYKSGDAQKVVQKIFVAGMTVEAVIRAALKSN